MELVGQTLTRHPKVFIRVFSPLIWIFEQLKEIDVVLVFNNQIRRMNSRIPSPPVIYICHANIENTLKVCFITCIIGALVFFLSFRYLIENSKLVGKSPKKLEYLTSTTPAKNASTEYIEHVGHTAKVLDCDFGFDSKLTASPLDVCIINKADNIIITPITKSNDALALENSNELNDLSELDTSFASRTSYDSEGYDTDATETMSQASGYESTGESVTHPDSKTHSSHLKLTTMLNSAMGSKIFDLDAFTKCLQSPGFKVVKMKTPSGSKRIIRLNSRGNIYWEKSIKRIAMSPFVSASSESRLEWPVANLLRVDLEPDTKLVSLVFDKKVIRFQSKTPEDGAYLAFGFHSLAVKVTNDPTYTPWLQLKSTHTPTK